MPNYITHAFIASKLSKNPEYIFGNAIADLEHVFLVNDKTHNPHKIIKKVIKDLETKPRLRSLALGLKHHMLLDIYAHKKFIIPTARKIAKKMDIKENRAHALLEFALAHKIIEENLNFFKLFKKIVDSQKHKEIKQEFFKVIKKRSFKKGYDEVIKVIKKNKFSVVGIGEAFYKLRKYSMLKNHETMPGKIRNYIKAYFEIHKIVNQLYKKEIADLINYQKRLLANEKL